MSPLYSGCSILACVYEGRGVGGGGRGSWGLGVGMGVIAGVVLLNSTLASSSVKVPTPTDAQGWWNEVVNIWSHMFVAARVTVCSYFISQAYKP